MASSTVSALPEYTKGVDASNGRCTVCELLLGFLGFWSFETHGLATFVYLTPSSCPFVLFQISDETK